MTFLKHLLPILLLSVEGILCGKGAKSPEDDKHLLGPNTPAGSQPGSGASSILTPESGSGSGKTMPAAQGMPNTASSTVTQEQFQRLFGVSLDPVKSGDPMKKGSCAPYKEKILTAYKEALDMIREATDAIDEIGMAGMGGEQSQLLRSFRLASPFWNLFNGASSGEHEDLAEIKSHYDSILTEHQLKPIDKSPKFHIRCGDEFLEWRNAKYSYPDRGGSGKLDKSTLSHPGPGKPAFPNGAWYAANMPPDHVLLAVGDAGPVGAEPAGSSLKSKFKSLGKGSSKAKEGLCGPPGTYAVSIPKDNLLILCPRILEIDKASSSSKAAPKEWSIAAVDKKIELTHTFDEYMPTLAQIWVHHIFHYALKWPEESTTDAQSPSHVLGWDAAEKVAKADHKKAMKSPESHAVYAAAMYLSNWASAWGGKAHAKAPFPAPAPAPAQKVASSGGSGHSDPFKDPVDKDPFRDPEGPDGSGSEAGSSGSSDDGGRHRVMRRFEA